MTVPRGLIALLTAVALGVAGRAGGAEEAQGEMLVGIVPQQTLGAADYELIAAGGVDSVRATLAWFAVELEPGSYEWAGYDAQVAAAALAGVTLLPVVFGSPSWTPEVERSDCEGEQCHAFGPVLAETREAFAAFAAAAVRRYGPGGELWTSHPELPERPITVWQIWNEQNARFFFRPEVDVAAYAELLRETAAQVRAADPAAELVLGGMWGPRDTEVVVPVADYLGELYEQKWIERSFDGVAVHPYHSRLRGVLEQLRDARRVMRRNGDASEPLWVTELSWASDGSPRQNLVKSEPRQARLLRRAFAALRRHAAAWRLRGAYWFSWRDTPPDAERVCSWCRYSGLLSADGEPKRAWERLREVAAR